MPDIADRQVLVSKRRFTADASLPSGPAALVGDPSLAMLAVTEIPRYLHARGAGAGAAGHHALLERAEGAGQAIVAVAPAVLHAPGPVGYGGSRARIDGGGGGDRKHGESGADHDHGYPPNTARPWNEHPAGPFLPDVEQGNRTFGMVSMPSFVVVHHERGCTSRARPSATRSRSSRR